MRKEEIICDRCGARKGESNHWWSLKVTSDTLTLAPKTYKTFDEDEKDLCSQNCVLLEINDYLNPSIKKESQ